MTSGRSLQLVTLCSVHAANSYLCGEACCQEPGREKDKEKEWGRENGGGERKESKPENCTVTKTLKFPFQPFPYN